MKLPTILELIICYVDIFSSLLCVSQYISSRYTEMPTFTPTRKRVYSYLRFLDRKFISPDTVQ